MGDPSAITVSVVDDYDVVVAGVAGMLAPFAQRVRIVETSTDQSVDRDVDVVLFDTFAQGEGSDNNVDVVLADPRAHRVAVYSWNTDPDVVRTAMSRGVHGYLDKALPAEQVVAGIEALHRGDTVLPATLDRDVVNGRLDWPGRAAGLTAREAEVLAFMVAGLRNPEIASKLCISPNSLKTHVRNVFRKTGARHRVEAVLWGIDHGFRLVEPGGSVQRWRPRV